MKIILLGYMGSGKSTLGKALSSLLNTSFIDLDAHISEKESLSIPEIFKTKGEIYFRLKEHEYLKELLSYKNNLVIATGGGTPCYANNMELINNTANTVSVYLQASIKTLVERLYIDKKSRPLIADINDEKLTEFVAKHLFERRFYYNQSKIKINTDDLSKNQTLEKIKTELNLH